MASLGHMRLLHFLLLLGACALWRCSAQEEMLLTLNDLFPFGTGEGDLELPTGNDEEVTVTLDTPILYFGEARPNITVRHNFGN